MATASACLCVFLLSVTGSSNAIRTQLASSDLEEDALLRDTLDIGSHEAAVSPLHRSSAHEILRPEQKLPPGVQTRVASLQSWFTTYFRERFLDITEFEKAKFRVVLVSGAAAWASGSRAELSDLDCWVYGIRMWKSGWKEHPDPVVSYVEGEAPNQMQRDEEVHRGRVVFPEIDGWDPLGDKYEAVAQHFEALRDLICARGDSKVAIYKMGWAEQLAFKFALITGGRGMQNGTYNIKMSDLGDLVTAAFGITADTSGEQLVLWQNYVRSQAEDGNEVFTKTGFASRRKFVEVKGRYRGRVHEHSLKDIFRNMGKRFTRFYEKWQNLLVDPVS